MRRYSPELHGSFPLHWFAVAPAVLATDSAWTERGRPVSAAQLFARLAPGLPSPTGTTPLPLHPWQARDLLQRPAVAALCDAGLLTDLGPYGDPWYPTSSIRTVHRPGSPAMLKLSLGLRITNSRRENLRKELHRGVEVHRLLRAGLAEQWQSAHPGFDIVRDPAWVAVDSLDGTPVPGLDALLRHNPFRSDDDALCIAALTTPRPWPGRTTMRSPLVETVARLAASTGRPVPAVSAEWFLRYLDHVVRPILALDALAGVALEAHQQNTLVLLDPAGWPIGGRYRDNQGYYFRDSHRAELQHRLPGIGSASDTFVSDAVTDERFAYYLGINNVLGLIGAFGSQHLADERVLLAAFRRFLGKNAGLGPLPAQLLDSPTLRCKANLLTRLGGLDELVGPVDTQSVYVTITNPFTTDASVPTRRRAPCPPPTPRPVPSVQPSPQPDTPSATCAAPAALVPARRSRPARLPGHLGRHRHRCRSLPPRTRTPTSRPGPHRGMDERPRGGRLLGTRRPGLDHRRSPAGPARRRRPQPSLPRPPRRHTDELLGDLPGRPRPARPVLPGTPPRHRYPPAHRRRHERGRGLGTTLLRAAADLLLDNRPRCARVIAEPDIRNTPSVSAFLNSGFRYSAEIDLPEKRAALMIRERALRNLI